MKYSLTATRTVEEEINVELECDNIDEVWNQFMEKHYNGELEGLWNTGDKTEPEPQTIGELK